MIKGKALKGFLLAFLFVLAGGFFLVQNGPFQVNNTIFPLSFYVGAAFILLGLLIGLFSSVL
ncbi:MAG TPA: hypothetical protein VKT82_33170 [Ktedonobacterales bacterium]|nr:hypothetical protein [Ktedonobacterales bacterium]